MLLQLNEVYTQITIGETKVNEADFQIGEPLSFSVTKQEDHFPLEFVKDFDHLLSYYNWGLLDGTFYELTVEQKEIYVTMQQLFKRFEQPVIDYPKEELANLFMKVLPYLRKIGRVQVAPEVQNEIEESELKAVFSLRKIKGQVDLQVDFTYGEVVFSSDEKHHYMPENHPEILRDFQQEARIEAIIETFGYQASTKNWQKSLPAGNNFIPFLQGDPCFKAIR